MGILQAAAAVPTVGDIHGRPAGLPAYLPASLSAWKSRKPMWGTATWGSRRDGERTTCATAKIPGRFRLCTIVSDVAWERRGRKGAGSSRSRVLVGGLRWLDGWLVCGVHS